MGHWVKDGVEYLTANFDGQFRVFSDGLEYLIVGTVNMLIAVPPLIFTGGIILLAYLLHRKWRPAMGLGLAMLLILNLGYWRETMETVALVLFATSISILVGVPVGILAARKKWIFVCCGRCLT